MHVEITRAQELELPREATIIHLMPITFLNGTQYARRLTGDSVNKNDVELAVVMPPERALMCARTVLYSAIAARNGYKFATTLACSDLEPGDVVILKADDINARVRITTKEESNGVIQFESVGDLKSAYERDQTPADYNAKGDDLDLVVADTGPLKTPIVRVHDLPKLYDGDDGPRVHVDFMQTMPKKFRGLVLTVCDIVEGKYIPRENSNISVRTLPTTGWCRNKLVFANVLSTDLFPDHFIDAEFQTSNGLDVHNSPIVKPHPVEEPNVYSGGLLAKVGDEIVAFDTQTPLPAEDGNPMYLTKLTRFRRCLYRTVTDPAIIHSAQEQISVIKTMVRVPLLKSDIGKEIAIRAVSAGGTLDDAEYTVFTPVDAGMKGVLTIEGVAEQMIPKGGTTGQVLTIQPDGSYAWQSPTAGGASGGSSESSWRGYIGNNPSVGYAVENTRYMMHNIMLLGSPAPTFSAWNWNDPLLADKNPKFTNAIYATMAYSASKSGFAIHLGHANGNNVGWQVKRGQSAPFKANWRFAIPVNLEFTFAAGIAFPSNSNTASGNFGMDNTFMGGLPNANAGIVGIGMERSDNTLQVISIYNGGTTIKVDTGIARATLINKYLDVTAELVSSGTEIEFTVIDIVGNAKLVDKVKVAIQAPGNNALTGRVFIGAQKWDAWPVFDRPQGLVLVSMMCRQPAFASI